MANHKPPTLIVEPDEGVKPMREAIDSARRALLMKQFSFNEPSLVEAAKAAHGRGVKVMVLLNPVRDTGERDNDGTFEEFKRAGIEVQWTNPAFVVTHEKSIVVDGARAYVATFNLSEKHFTERRDYGILTHDLGQVDAITACFTADWHRLPFKPAPDSELVWSVVDARRRMASFIDTAEQKLYVQHPKFVDLSIIERIIHARHRGVEVHVLTGGLHGLHADDLPETCAALRLFHRFDIKVHAQKHPKLHGKLIIADHKRALMGSMNIHRNAFDHRRELGMVVHDRNAVEGLLAVYKRDWEASEPFHAPAPLEVMPAGPENDI